MEFFRRIYEELSLNTPLAKGIRIFIIILVAFILKITFEILIRKLARRTNGARINTGKVRTVFSVIKNVINVFIYFLAISQILAVFNINTSSILAVAGVGGMAIAFASKSVIEDLISGIFILLENQYEIGHFVTIGNIDGTVKEMGMRLTKLENSEGKEIIIPNGNISTVINHSINNMTANVDVFITDSTPYDKVLEALELVCDRAFEKNKNFIEEPVVLGITSMDQYSYTVKITSRISNGMQYKAQRDIREEVVRTLQEYKIGFSGLGD